ncbi:Sugar transporter [Penicillium digitatum PHI26]|uniref:Sugar transporter n=3 Tax=Penicillium TaxID=5073 RepID=K9FQI0_PEND2|nr:Sugar transporter [Penicillium digitatum Pd1]EKV10672.1 Sugar transporter [Penicillium digitatum PHI26]EKV13082.1 Sugar transporter [Penicillium digitatum Pd1]
MAISQSVVGRANAEKPHGLKGFISNPYVFFTCLFASLGCIMYGYD